MLAGMYNKTDWHWIISQAGTPIGGTLVAVPVHQVGGLRNFDRKAGCKREK
jgi:hypothetical protein